MNVLAFFAHPDDETMLAGGTLALLARQGVQVHYLSATRGEGGEAGEPPLCSLEDLGQVREEELACAVAALGGSSLDFLGYTDPRVGPDDELYAYSDDLETGCPPAGEPNSAAECRGCLYAWGERRIRPSGARFNPPGSANGSRILY